MNRAFDALTSCGLLQLIQVRQELTDAIKSHQATFGIEMSDPTIEHLADYYELVQERSPVLHLVAPCTAEEFATRHILESLTLLEFLPRGARFADVGTGAGLPAIPCLIARDDLSAVLIESKEKKTDFLADAAAALALDARVEIINRQFSEVVRPNVSHVTCRALDKFTERLPALLKWSRGASILFFGGPALGGELKKRGVQFRQKLMPGSLQRYLFAAGPGTVSKNRPPTASRRRSA